MNQYGAQQPSQPQQSVAPIPPPQMQQLHPPTNGGKKKLSTGAKVAIGLSIGTVVLLLVGVFVILTFLKSCDAWLNGTEETHDTREVAAFVSDPTVTERDLETFDTLRPIFEEMYLDVDVNTAKEERPVYQNRRQRHAEAAAYVDSFRVKLERGTWPTDDPVFYGPEYAASPQLWVRIAELSQNHLEKETGEQWCVLAFSYPSRIIEEDYAVPLVEKHSVNDALITSLECVSGSNAGMTVDVGYYRWANPAYFASEYNQRSEVLQKRRDQEVLVWESGLLDGRQYAIDGVYQRIYVWSSGEVDFLRNPDNFMRTLDDLAEATGMEGLELVLLEVDASAFRNRSFKTTRSYRVELEVVPACDVPKAILMDVCKADSFSFAPDDVLLQQMISSDVEVSRLRGSLVPDEDEPLHDWRSTYQMEADVELSAFVSEQLGLAEDQAIALSGVDKAESYTISVVVPRGALAETPDSAEEGVRNLQQALWQRIFAEAEERDSYTIHLYLYVIDVDDLTGPDGAATFADLHAAVMADTQAIKSYNAASILRAHLSSYAYDNEVENVADGWVTDYGVELEGVLTESRAWYLALAEERQ